MAHRSTSLHAAGLSLSPRQSCGGAEGPKLVRQDITVETVSGKAPISSALETWSMARTRLYLMTNGSDTTFGEGRCAVVLMSFTSNGCFTLKTQGFSGARCFQLVTPPLLGVLVRAFASEYTQKNDIIPL